MFGMHLEMLWVVLGCGRDDAYLLLAWGWRSKVLFKPELCGALSFIPHPPSSFFVFPAEGIAV